MRLNELFYGRVLFAKGQQKQRIAVAKTRFLDSIGMKRFQSRVTAHDSWSQVTVHATGNTVAIQYVIVPRPQLSQEMATLPQCYRKK
jgi:hypothetical protein